jgi:methylenetetrahydrofolate dehydrogenase (NADP+)/methenyltetrahydrofolate cyclohydrolase
MTPASSPAPPPASWSCSPAAAWISRASTWWCSAAACIVGKPVALLALQKKAWANGTVTICHSGTANLPALTRQADVLIAAIGKPEFVTADMVKPGAVVIDVGINRVPDTTKKTGYRLTGDVHFPSVAPLCAKITPVPGGVGPMTVAMLMKNTVKAHRLKNHT